MVTQNQQGQFFDPEDELDIRQDINSWEEDFF